MTKFLEAIFLSLLLSLISCSSPDVEFSRKTRLLEKTPSNKIWNLYVKVMDKEILTAVIKAGMVSQYNDRGKQNLSFIDSSLFINYLNSNGSSKGSLRSIRGIIDEQKQLFTAIEKVVLNTEKGYTLHADTLYWDRKQKIIFTNSEVEVINSQEGTVINGTGFKADESLLNYEIENPVIKTKIKEKLR